MTCLILFFGSAHIPHSNYLLHVLYKDSVSAVWISKGHVHGRAAEMEAKCYCRLQFPSGSAAGNFSSYK